MSTDQTLQRAVASIKKSKPSDGSKFLYKVVGAASFAHFLNDLIQAVLPSIYPMLKDGFKLNFAQVGMIALVYQFTASLLQPCVGLYTDKRPTPYLLPWGMVLTMFGIAMLAYANSFEMLLAAAAVIGIGSSTFHPEASRIARLASGGHFGTAQSSFQVGGNTGQAVGPLIVAAIIIPFGQSSITWVLLAAVIAVVVLCRLTYWMLRHGQTQLQKMEHSRVNGLTKRKALQAVLVVSVLMFAKFVYIASFTNYFTFYLIEKFGVSVRESQIYLFVYLGAVAVGTFAGGPVGDRIGRKAVIWISFLGVVPFALLLPYANLLWTTLFVIAIGLVMSSAFSALVVYAQEAVPGKVGTISGLMFGLMFGIGGVAAAGLGGLADVYGIEWVYKVASYLPLLGLVTMFLPDTCLKR